MEQRMSDVLGFDPFGGSFATMVAVHNKGMSGISCELDEEFFSIGLERLMKHINGEEDTGKW